MSLFELIDNDRTDKNTAHSYLELYQQWFEPRKYTAKNVLEIGIGPHLNISGGSIRMWYDFFPNANIHAIDIVSREDTWSGIKNVKNESHEIVLHTSCDAYDENWFCKTFLIPQIKFDIVIDDGPHSLESQVQFIKLYSQLLTEDGILVVEDVPDIRWIDVLWKAVPEHLKPYIKVHDLRHIKNRWDDIMFVIDLSKYAV